MRLFASYLRTAWRNLIKHKVFSFINIAGLAVGMACCILIFLWVKDELSFDRFHPNHARLYRAVVRNDAYRTDLPFWIYLGAGILAYLVALLTVGYQAFKAARTEPVNAMKYE